VASGTQLPNSVASWADCGPGRGASLGLGPPELESHGFAVRLMTNWMLQSEAFDVEVVGAQARDAYLAGLGVAAYRGTASTCIL